MPDRYSEAEIERMRERAGGVYEIDEYSTSRLVATLDAIKAERDRAVEAVETLRKAAVSLLVTNTFAVIEDDANQDWIGVSYEKLETLRAAIARVGKGGA